MNKTVKLMNVLGSPFIDNLSVSLKEDEAMKLFLHAKQNKVDLLYLQKLFKIGNYKELHIEYVQKLKNYKIFLTTIKRLFKAMEKEGLEGVAFKSLLPFPTNLNDVDVLILNTRLINAVRKLERYGYEKFAIAPSSISLHDSRDCSHLDPTLKDPYDIDIYIEIAANRIVYFDKNKIKRWLKGECLMGTRIVTLLPEADLAVQLMHSVFPEQLYTLLHYYSILYYLSFMDEQQISNFLDIIEENHIIHPIIVALTLTAILHGSIHGEIPDKLKDILAALRINLTTLSNYKMNHKIHVPIRYSLQTVMRTLIGKACEFRTVSSILLQIVYMCNPKIAEYILSHFLLRRRRTTY